MLTIPAKIPKNGFYYHYKHNPNESLDNYAYEVLGVGFHTENDFNSRDYNLVVYRPLYPTASVYMAGRFFDVRPLEMFMEDVELNGIKIPRFKKIENPEIIKKLEVIRDQMYS